MKQSGEYGKRGGEEREEGEGDEKEKVGLDYWFRNTDTLLPEGGNCHCSLASM